MAWNPSRFNFFSPDRPGPSLHICSGSPASADFALDGVANTAAATSLTSFINVSGQPKSRKREQGLFSCFWVHVQAEQHFWPIFGGFLPVEAPDFSRG